ncbi:MAG: GNAT family N-acetyltransferase [Desulfosporosinus sp.]|nr:GNAT family N-acetyltransferase [Desulfosporosinus sp.]
MLIREATETDLVDIRKLLIGMDGEDGEGVNTDEAHTIWLKINDYPYYKIFVVEENTGIIGTCSLIILDNLGHKGAKLAIAENMIVSEECRGSGVGSQLMQFIMAKAKEENCYKLMLSSNKKRIMAHKFYEQLGFQQHGISFMIEIDHD